MFEDIKVYVEFCESFGKGFVCCLCVVGKILVVIYGYGIEFVYVVLFGY